MGRQHKGLDIKVYIGDTIRAAFSGKVRIVRYEAGGYGKYIVIRHPNGLETIYGHLFRTTCHGNQSCVQAKSSVLEVIRAAVLAHISIFETRLCGVA